MLAALVVRAMARVQTWSGSERDNPRYRSVADRRGPEPDSPAPGGGERCLEHAGCVVASSPDPRGDSCTDTEAGWEALGHQTAASGWRRRPWWKGLPGV